MQGFKPSVDGEILEFARFLMLARSSEEETVAERRARLKALREHAKRIVPSVYRVKESTFEGLRYRVYYPTALPSIPAAVFFHGGGWCMLDIDTYDPLIRRLALASGAAVVALDYPLAPEAPYPVALNACTTFVRYVAASGESGGEPVALVGDSAGANLAVSVALNLRDGGERLIAGLGLVYGAYDLANERDSYLTYGSGDLPLTLDDMLASRRSYVTDPSLLSTPLVSPLMAELHGLPPAFVQVASHDPLFDENVEMAARLGRAGCDVTMRIYPGTIHGFLEADSINGARLARLALDDLGHFVGSTSKPRLWLRELRMEGEDQEVRPRETAPANAAGALGRPPVRRTPGNQ